MKVSGVAAIYLLTGAHHAVSAKPATVTTTKTVVLPASTKTKTVTLPASTKTKTVTLPAVTVTAKASCSASTSKASTTTKATTKGTTKSSTTTLVSMTTLTPTTTLATTTSTSALPYACPTDAQFYHLKMGGTTAESSTLGAYQWGNYLMASTDSTQWINFWINGPYIVACFANYAYPNYIQAQLDKPSNSYWNIGLNIYPDSDGVMQCPNLLNDPAAGCGSEYQYWGLQQGVYGDDNQTVQYIVIHNSTTSDRLLPFLVPV
ncbi:hypothetical protein K461DRAFT_275293 [Myriangium duriaei CBS 260.36]|uniref:Uncharacterized protein n=1 Tax=Myriangium duriaei CBS 260.36 TaxID=1168546 RepID=A0A9P4MR32_9PEZI|nr:hypothetical protein K461DRAFT_275293 [Myriangium duriaei CBS 260.36]